MRLQFLGTGGYHPSERRHTACLLLPEIGVAFDAGSAFFRVPPRLETDELDVFLSHAHLDHVQGLTFPLVAMQQGVLKRMRIHGKRSHLEAVRTHILSSPLFPVDPDFEYVELGDRIPVGGDGVLTHVDLEHPGGAVGFRIDWPDRSFAYVTDTTAPGPYAEFVRGVDVLVHECYFPDEMAEWAGRTGHSHATAVARLAADVDPGRLYLVHTDPQTTDDDPIGLPGFREIFERVSVPDDRDEVVIEAGR